MSLPVFFFNDTATTEIYTLSLHDALPIFGLAALGQLEARAPIGGGEDVKALALQVVADQLDQVLLVVDHQNRAYSLPFLRSEEHTSELQSQSNLVCRLLLEKKKKYKPKTV